MGHRDVLGVVGHVPPVVFVCILAKRYKKDQTQRRSNSSSTLRDRDLSNQLVVTAVL